MQICLAECEHHRCCQVILCVLSVPGLEKAWLIHAALPTTTCALCQPIPGIDPTPHFMNSSAADLLQGESMYVRRGCWVTCTQCGQTHTQRSL